MCKWRAVFYAMLAAVFIFLAGCAKKSLSKAELRGITGEIVAAAQKATQRRSGITIRPEQAATRGRSSARLAADNIYVTLSGANEADALGQALDGIARRHSLSLTETTSGGVVRFEYTFHGTRTHTIHVVTPLAARPFVAPKQGSAGPQLAIILDDLGYDRAAADALFALPFPLTVSVLPHLPLSTEVAEEAFRRGDQVLLHLPMESEVDGAKPEEIELHVGMNTAQVEGALEGMLETVPHAIGVNNHQGSRATSDPALMAALMPALHQRGLFFIDSRTTAATVAYDAAERSGVRAASRKVFLDDTPTREAVLAQLDLAARDAQRDGSAIAIGHPHAATIAALSEGIPRLESRGIRLVFASQVVH
ncbi:MAG TPA: divergent polysaccharide deacetylase family protein [archaeon]|nr:divergent polysaccharide deacetylase family protein [archaeon]